MPFRQSADAWRRRRAGCAFAAARERPAGEADEAPPPPPLTQALEKEENREMNKMKPS